MNSTMMKCLLAAVPLTILLSACAGATDAFPPPANPFLAGANPLQNTTLAQPAQFGLVWLVPTGSAVPSQEAQRKLAEKIKAQFTDGKRLEIIGTTILPVSQDDLLSDIRKASAPLNVPRVLVVMPAGVEVVSPVWLYFGRNGNATGNRTDSYFTVALVGLDLASGKSLFSVVSKGEAELLATDYEDARPFYPSISPGRSSAFIYPDKANFPPGEVHAVALEQAVNDLIYQLDRALGS
jgi:hypothetical protein